MTVAGRIVLPFVTLLLSALYPLSAHAWGAAGHRFITDTAVEELPPPLRTFFQTYKTLFKNEAANEPAGKHFIDIDYYPEFFSHTFPHDIDVLVAEYGNSTVTANGRGPWTATTNYNTLRAAFAAAQTLTDWTNLLTVAGATAHYIEDLHNPLHLATNYNGQYTDQTGLHSRYESTLITRRLTNGLALATNPAACVYYPSLLDAIFTDIDTVYPNNAPLLAADLAAYAAAGDRSSDEYYQHLWDDGCSGFTPGVMQKATDMVASALYSAWREAGFPQPYGVPVSTTITLQLLSANPDGVRFRILGDVGQKIDVQTTTTFLDWTLHATVTNSDGRVEVTAPAASESQRYYRARLVQ